MKPDFNESVSVDEKKDHPPVFSNRFEHIKCANDWTSSIINKINSKRKKRNQLPRLARIIKLVD